MMLPRGRRVSTLFARVLCLALCSLLVLSSIPLPFKNNSAKAQSAQAAVLKRSLPPHSNLPNVAALLTEGKNSKRPALPKPPLQPSTLCGYRDKACKTKEKKSKKTAQSISPSGSQDIQVAASHTELVSHTEPASRSWRGRLGGAVSSAVSGVVGQGFFNAKVGGSNFLASSQGQLKKPMPTSLANASAMVMMAPPAFHTYAEALLDPHNRVGEPGEDLFSGNYHWSLPLLSLPGRAGLGLNLS